MKRYFLLLLLGGLALGLQGCASDDSATASNAPSGVRTTPWNRPERWEGQGMMGGMMNTR